MGSDGELCSEKQLLGGAKDGQLLGGAKDGDNKSVYTKSA